MERKGRKAKKINIRRQYRKEERHRDRKKKTVAVVEVEARAVVPSLLLPLSFFYITYEKK